MADSDVQGTFRDGSLTGNDDKSGTPNSATVSWYNGDLQIKDLIPKGRDAMPIEGPEGVRAIRQGRRKYPTLTFTGDVAALATDFSTLAHGLTSGFVSTMPGDYACVDLEWTATYGTSTRTATFEDCALTGYDIAEGEPNRATFTFTVYGPVTIGGDAVIASR